MGAAASIAAELPDLVDKIAAQKALGERFDEEKFAAAAGADGTISKADFLAAISATSSSEGASAEEQKPTETGDTNASASTNIKAATEAEAKQNKPKGDSQHFLWLCGDSGSGKTFLGDYLATRGWSHIDGDQGNQSNDPDVQQKWGKLYQAMTLHQNGKADEVSEDLWRPYYAFLVRQFKEASKEGKNVVLSFALLDIFGERSFLEAEIPGIKFVVVEMSEDILLERLLARSKLTLEKAGTTEEEVWKQDYMVDYRKRYGEEYTPERYRQMTIDGAKELVWVKRDANDKSIVVINNDDFENFSSIKALNQLVGLEWEDVDSQKIADVNMKRMENLNTGEAAFGSTDTD